MKEYEAKIIIDCSLFTSIRERLRRLGARPLEEVVEEDTYYQHPCRDFAETDEALRLRVRPGRCELTYKGPKEPAGGGVKARLELTIQLPPGERKQLHEILLMLGFKPVAVVRKERTYYSLGEVTVSLDHVHGLGCFVEIEYSGGPHRDPTKAIEEAAHRLGLARQPRTTKSYLELLLERLHTRNPSAHS